VRTGRHVCKRQLASFHQRLNTLLNISTENACVIAKRRVARRGGCDSLHLLELIRATSDCIEEVKAIERASFLEASLSDIVVAKRDRCLSQLIKELGFFDLLSCLEGNLDVTTSKGEVIPLSGVFLEEKSDLAVALLLEIANDRSSA